MTSRRELSAQFSDVVATTVTPYAADGTIDHSALASHVTFLADQGIKVLVPGANTGEFSSLSVAELKGVFETVAQAVGDRVTVVAGVGLSGPIAIELTKHAKTIGIPVVMIHHPTHTYIDRIELRHYYEAIMEAADVGVVLYKRGPEVSDQLLAELAGAEQVVAVKYAVNDLNAFANLVATTSQSTTWLCGTAERWAPFFHVAGAKGFTSGLANFAPGKSLAMMEALRSGDFSAAMSMRGDMVEFEELRQQAYSSKNVSAVKEAMAQLGLCDRAVRAPLGELNEADRAVVTRVLGSWGLSRATAS